MEKYIVIFFVVCLGVVSVNGAKKLDSVENDEMEKRSLIIPEHIIHVNPKPKVLRKVRNCPPFAKCNWKCVSDKLGEVPVDTTFTTQINNKCHQCSCKGPQFNGIRNQVYSVCREQHCYVPSSCIKKVQGLDSCCATCVAHGGGHHQKCNPEWDDDCEEEEEEVPFTFPPLPFK